MATLKPPESQLLKTLTSILASEKTHLLETLNPYIPQISQPLISSLLSSPSLAKKPENLVSFFHWVQSSIPEAFPSNSPLPLLTVVRSLLSHHKFADAKSLLVSYIRTSDASLSLCNSLLQPNLHLSPPPSKALLDISLSAYLQAGKPLVALQIFQKMIRLKLKPNLLTCNTLLIGLVRHPSSFSLSTAREVFNEMVKLGVSLNVKTFNVLVNGFSPDRVTYHTLINGYLNIGDLSAALEMMREMGQKGMNIGDLQLCWFCFCISNCVLIVLFINLGSDKDALQALKASDWHLETAFDMFYSQPHVKLHDLPLYLVVV